MEFITIVTLHLSYNHTIIDNYKVYYYVIIRKIIMKKLELDQFFKMILYAII